jgi:hypothetical protein
VWNSEANRMLEHSQDTRWWNTDSWTQQQKDGGTQQHKKVGTQQQTSWWNSAGNKVVESPQQQTKWWNTAANR